MYCQICQALGGSKNVFESRQCIDQHVLLHCGQYLDDITTLDQMYIACFGITFDSSRRMRRLNFANCDRDPLEPRTFGQTQKMTMINNCNTILQKWQSGNGLINNKVVCNICNETIYDLDRAGAIFRIEPAVDHARGHLKLPMYTCTFCIYETDSPDGIGKHLKLNHALFNNAEAALFRDCSEAYADAIVEKFALCFNQNGEPMQNQCINAAMNQRITPIATCNAMSETISKICGSSLENAKSGHNVTMDATIDNQSGNASPFLEFP